MRIVYKHWDEAKDLTGSPLFKTVVILLSLDI